MKNFSKKVLVFGAVALSLSNVTPAFAMMQRASNVYNQATILAARGYDGVMKRARSTGKSITNQVNDLIKCSKAGNCAKGQKAGLYSAVAAFIITITALTIAGAHKIDKKWNEGKMTARAQGAAASTLSDIAEGAGTAYGTIASTPEYVRTLRAKAGLGMHKLGRTDIADIQSATYDYLNK